MNKAVRLGDLAELQRGTSYKGALLGLPGPVLLGLGTIARNGGFRGDNLKTYGGSSPEKILAHPGDLYVSLKDVTHKAELLGAVARVPSTVAVGRLTQDTVRVDIKDDCVDVGYLYQALQTPDYRAYCKSRSTGTTNLDLSREAFFSYTIRLPELAAQRAIAEVLGALDDKIAANIQLASTITYLLEAESSLRWLTPSSSSEGVPVSEVIEFNPAVKMPSEPEPIYVDMKKLPESGIGISDWDRRPAKGGARFELGDTLLARITPCLENHKTGYVDFLLPNEIGIGSTEFIVMRSRGDLSRAFSYFLAVNEDFRDFAIRHMVGTSGRQRVSANDLLTYTVPRLDPVWALDFGTRAETQFAFMKSLRDESRTLAELRDTLLPQLMSGKLRVKDAEKSLEEVL